MEQRIREIIVSRQEVRSGLLAKKISSVEQVCLRFGGGSVYVTERAVGGDPERWEQLKLSLEELSRREKIPVKDARDSGLSPAE